MTKGVVRALLTNPLINLLRLNDVSLGISLDGPQGENDRFRLTHGGSDRTCAWSNPSTRSSIKSSIRENRNTERYQSANRPQKLPFLGVSIYSQKFQYSLAHRVFLEESTVGLHE